MSKRILIVDDEPNILISIEFLMKREGYDVAIARDGEEGLEAIRAQRPDLVVLDVMMPGGGYCLGTGNSVANYIPLDNYLAMVDEGRLYGA